MVKEKAEELGIDLNAIDNETFTKREEKIHKIIEEQPYTKAAFAYAETVNKWFESNKTLFENKAEELMSLAQAEIPGVRPDKDALKIQDCIEIIRWYQHQIYVKLCRAASGMLCGEFACPEQGRREDTEYCPEDANGSAKVAIIGIERSIAAWGGFLNEFADHEQHILELLLTLKKLLKQVDAAFPDARAFVRPGFDTAGKR